MENEMLCSAMERFIIGMPAGEKDIFREAVRRLRISGGRLPDRIVELAGSLNEMHEFALHLTQENAKLKDQLEQLHRDVTLHVQYDLEEEGCGAVLQEGFDKYYVSALALAELLEARRDGRLVILDKEEHK